jgi:DNA invertase Pin-like site-specific DNA recombinase
MFKDAVISILATIAKQERVRLSERVTAGLERARAQGRVGGRRSVVRDSDKAMIVELRKSGTSYGKIAARLGLNKQTVYRVFN